MCVIHFKSFHAQWHGVHFCATRWTYYFNAGEVEVEILKLQKKKQ